jgi:hypothetical protein
MERDHHLQQPFPDGATNGNSSFAPRNKFSSHLHKFSLQVVRHMQNRFHQLASRLCNMLSQQSLPVSPNALELDYRGTECFVHNIPLV